jgi:methionyl-tRNA formyltransferase
MAIVFIGTPEFSVPSLRALVAAGLEVGAVITQPDRPAGRGRRLRASAVKEAALELGLPLLQPESLKDSAAVAEIEALHPEALVAVAYGQILRPNVLAIAPRGVINVHPSLLPRWRGASPVQAALLAGETETGVTIMLMDAGMDSGPVLSQERAFIEDDDTAGTLLARLAVQGADLLVRTLPRWLTDEITPVPQDDALATTCPLIRKDDARIDWTLPAREIWLRVRAFNPWPGADTTLEGETLHIWRALPLDSESGEPVGTVVATAHGFAVQTGSGLLEVVEAQRAGRRPLSAQELLRGWPSLIGARFGR